MYRRSRQGFAVGCRGDGLRMREEERLAEEARRSLEGTRRLREEGEDGETPDRPDEPSEPEPSAKLSTGRDPDE